MYNKDQEGVYFVVITKFILHTTQKTSFYPYKYNSPIKPLCNISV